MANTDEEKEKWRNELAQLVSSQEARFRDGKNRWNFWYYTSMYGAVLLSALAALVLKLETASIKGDWQTDAAALLATFAAILGTVSSTGNFEGRWRTSRKARASMLKLQADLKKPDANLDDINSRYKEAITDYQDGVVGNDK